ncbi:MAG: DUF4159 domain-containing protein [Planctomycetes bacterium]|nr:DUF4159 domain-containing protein [Planctomycetota bacterium]
MKGLLGSPISILCIAVFFPSPALAQRSANVQANFSAEAVEKAVDKACEFLLVQQKPDGAWPPHPDGNGSFSSKEEEDNFRLGTTALVCYALLEKGMKFDDPNMKKALDWLAAQKTDWTYALAFRTQVWLRAAKQDPKGKWRKLLEQDVNHLIKATKDGGYAYESDAAKPAEGRDNSNSQYGVLGVWAGYRAGMEIPREYWDKVVKFWVSGQKADGGWAYSPGKSAGGWEARSSGTMTAAGIATMFVCVDAIMGDKFKNCNQPTEVSTIKKGLDWYDKYFPGMLAARNHIQIDVEGEISGVMQCPYSYWLYGLERIGLASGYKYFGAMDWYRMCAAKIIGTQDQSGAWGENARMGPIPETAYAVLFLIRGQRGVIMNRLEYDGDWNNRPRALANFCRWAEGVYEQEVNWQIITLKSDVGEWHDAAVVAVSGSKAPKFSDEDIAKLRTYVQQGGTIFSMTECGGVAAFGKGMKDVYRKMFPKYEMADAGRDHPVYTTQYKLGPAVRLSMISNGIRPLAIHTDVDLPLSWQTYAVATARLNFEAAANVLMYVTDKQIKNRGSTLWPSEPAKAPGKSIKAARLRYAGNYDPEPLALQRFARLMGKLYDLKIECVPGPGFPASAPAGGPPDSLPPTGIAAGELTGDIKLAVLTGTGAFKLSDDDKQAIKKWVEAGGLLVVDAGGGAKGFADSARELIGELWGADNLLPMPISSPVYQLKDITIEKVRYRKVTRAKIGGIREPRLLAVQAGDRPKVVFSAEDLTGGLVGYSSWGIDGYESESAFDLIRNLALYAASAPALPAATQQTK